MAMASLVGFLAFAVVDWVAVARQVKRVEYVAKPAALVALLIYAAMGPAASPWLLAALVLSLCGDVALMLPADFFVVGLAAFLLAHVAYIIDFEATVATRVVWLAIVLAVAFPLARRIIRCIGDTSLRLPVGVYMVAIALMVASAAASGSALAAAGAILFFSSDTVIAWNRFVRPFAWAQPVIMVTYHVGQLALATALRAG
jgi:alkenylglycerophosphocholine/alkenylglycerophosphoethanolamine hydrolase